MWVLKGRGKNIRECIGAFLMRVMTEERKMMGGEEGRGEKVVEIVSLFVLGG